MSKEINHKYYKNMETIDLIKSNPVTAKIFNGVDEASEIVEMIATASELTVEDTVKFIELLFISDYVNRTQKTMKLLSLAVATMHAKRMSKIVEMKQKPLG